MGLDASVCCNCFEAGRLKIPPRPEWRVYVADAGYLECTGEEIEIQTAFDRWRNANPCEHEDGILIHHRIGNAALVGWLREKLQEAPLKYPIILDKVLYSGIHAGDWIDIPDVEAMLPEIESLSEMHSPQERYEAFLRGFEQQMKELVACALKVGKPIWF